MGDKIEAYPTINFHRINEFIEGGIKRYLDSRLSYYILKSYMDSHEFAGKVVTVRFNRTILPFHTLEIFRELAIRPANLRELIAFGGQYMDDQRQVIKKYEVISCGTPIRRRGETEKFWKYHNYYDQFIGGLSEVDSGRPRSRHVWFLGVPLDNRYTPSRRRNW